jgi:dihydroorotase
MDTTKMKYLQTIGMHRMFLNVATFSVTKRSISSTKKKKKIFLNIFTCYINDYLTTEGFQNGIKTIAPTSLKFYLTNNSVGGVWSQQMVEINK